MVDCPWPAAAGIEQAILPLYSGFRRSCQDWMLPGWTSPRVDEQVAHHVLGGLQAAVEVGRHVRRRLRQARRTGPPGRAVRHGRVEQQRPHVAHVTLLAERPAGAHAADGHVEPHVLGRHATLDTCLDVGAGNVPRIRPGCRWPAVTLGERRARTRIAGQRRSLSPRGERRPWPVPRPPSPDLGGLQRRAARRRGSGGRQRDRRPPLGPGASGPQAVPISAIVRMPRASANSWSFLPVR